MWWHLLIRCPLWLALLATSAAVVAAEPGFEQWKSGEQGAFSAWLSEQDRAFAGFLGEQWPDVGVLASEQRGGPAPLPVEVFAAPAPGIDVIVEDSVPQENRFRVRKARASGDAPGAGAANRLRLEFYGQPLDIAFSAALRAPFSGRPVEADIARHFGRLASARIDALLADLTAAQGRYQLNDWAYLLLLAHVARAVHGDDRNSRRLLLWYLALRSGKDLRLAIGDDALHVLCPVSETVFGVPFVRVGDARYFILEPGVAAEAKAPATLRAYNTPYPKATADISLMLRRSPLFPTARPETRRWRVEKTKVEVELDGERSRFYADFPQAEWRVMLSATVSEPARSQLLDELRPLIHGLPPREAAAALLHFVQYGFAYVEDERQFGHERYLFPEATLINGKGDCEDRAALLAWLYRELLQVPVIGVEYPGHAVVALKLPPAQPPAKNNDGVLEWQGQQWVLADASYRGAPLGVVLPAIRGKEVLGIWSADAP